MTSACIFEDTFRNDTQVFLKIRISILEICLHLINSNFTSYSLPSSTQRTSNKIPLQKNGLALSTILITLLFSFFEISFSLDKFIYSCLIKCPPIFRWLRVIPTCSMWNKSQTNLVHSGTTHQMSLNRLRNSKPTRKGCPQSHRSHPQNPEFSP